MSGIPLFDWVREQIEQGEAAKGLQVLADYLAAAGIAEPARAALRNHPLLALLSEDPFLRRPMPGREASIDDELIDHACDRVPPTETGRLGQALFAASTDMTVARAIRARRDMVSRRLVRAWAEGLRICALGSGRFREGDALTGRDLTSLTLVDPNPDALAQARSKHGTSLVLEQSDPIAFLQMSALRGERFDLVYSVWGADRLDEVALAALYRLVRPCLNPKGTLFLSGFAPVPSVRGWMSAVMDRHPTYRTAAMLLQPAAAGDFAAILLEDTPDGASFCEAVLR